MPTTSYTLRAIDADLMHDFKVQAAKDGETTKSVLLQLMRAYADGRVELGVST